MSKSAFSREDAERQVAAYLERARPDFEVLSQETKEYRGVWLIFANTHAYAISGDMRDMEIGGGAILVDSRNGEMYASGGAERSEFWVDRYLSGNLTGLDRMDPE